MVEFFIVLGMLVTVWLLWVVRDRHQWVYRNPFDRTCKCCHQQEVKYCWDMESWRRDWWEIQRDGDPGKCGNPVPEDNKKGPE